jgi:hypothetical protein
MKDSKDPNQKRDEGYATAAVRFKDCFNMDLMNLKMKQCTKNMFEEFVDFLMAYDQNSRHSNSTEEIKEIKYYALGTVHQYLSGVYNQLSKTFDTLPMWSENMQIVGRDMIPAWYKRLREKCVRTIVQRVIEAGEKIQNKSEPIGQPLLEDIGHALLEKNSTDCVYMWTDFNWDYQSVGRTAEISTATYNTSYWDDVAWTLKVDWSMEKVSAQKLLYIYPHYTSFVTCPFFSKCCYRIVGNGVAHKSDLNQEHWMFPNMAMSSDPVKKMNGTLKSLVRPPDFVGPSAIHVNRLTGSYTGTSFRIGAMNTIMDHPAGDYKHAVMRSGQDHRNVCSMFEYLHASPKLVATAGKILAEYSDPERHVHTPRLIFLTVENEDLITNLMVELLNISDDGVMSKTGRLWPYSCCLFATFVMRYFDFAEKYPTHIITKTFNQKLRLFGIAISDVRSWSEAVQDDFERRNRRAASSQSVESLTNVIRAITEDTNKIIGTLATMTSSLSALSARVDFMEKIVHTVHDLQVVLASSQDVTMTPTPTRKRSLASMEDQEEGVLNSTTTVAPASRESSRPLRPLLVLHGNSLKEYDMGHMLCDYILHDVKSRQVADPRDNKDNVRRMNIVYNFLMSCASVEEKRLLLSSSIPELDDPDYMRWLQGMRNTCTAVKHAAMSRLLQIEEEVFGGDKTKGAKKALVTGVERRITFLKSKFNVHVVSYQLKSERGGGVLGLAISSSAMEK